MSKVVIAWLRSLFTSRDVEETGTSQADDFDSVKERIELLLEVDFSSEDTRVAYGDSVREILRLLGAKIENTQQQADGYPAKPISASVWMNGAGYGNLACALTEHFRSTGWLQCEATASALWAKATLAVCSHYHHLVGPAMLAAASCQDRLGDTDRATQMYSSVVADFAFLVDEWAGEPESPSHEERISFASLLTAVERLLDNGITELDSIELASLRSRVEETLSRPRAE